MYQNSHREEKDLGLPLVPSSAQPYVGENMLWEYLPALPPLFSKLTSFTKRGSIRAISENGNISGT
jgi:hypothetical protein